jgi:hypothetical protein
MNRAFTAVALAGLLVLAGCSGAPVDTAAATAEPATDGAETTIVTTGTGSVTAQPDTAVLRLAVVATADSAEAARADAAERTDTLLAALSDAGVAEDAVTTVGYSLTTQYDYSGSEREAVGYRAVHTLRVETTPDEAGGVIDAAVGAAGVEVHGVQFTLSDDKREQLRADAVAAAMNAARADADAAAGAADLSVTGVEQVRVDSSPGYTVRFAETADTGTELRPGEVSVQVTVTVTYRAA